MSDELLAWCVVANVSGEAVNRPGAGDARPGLKHFAPGAKLWVLPPQWGDGAEHLIVVGRHRGRGTGPLIRIVVPRLQLNNFRVRGIYSPAVYRQLCLPWAPWGDHPLRPWESQEQAEQAARWWNEDAVRLSGLPHKRQRATLTDRLHRLTPGFLANNLSTNLAWEVAVLVSGAFGDPPDTAGAIGGILRDQREAATIDRLLEPLRAITDDLGPAADGYRRPTFDEYTAHPLWPDVLAAAEAAHALLTTPPAGTRQ
ncbi:MAG TPA: hypothetical protein VFW65_35425 [Pseudonocardiaceae bacterium]|nr:hypothetical protein [Pseudonocardiaceae bacterium]